MKHPYKSVPVYPEDHKKLKQMSVDTGKPVVELINNWLKRK